MFSQVLVTTDGSGVSDRIVECLKPLRQVGTRKILLTHVFNVRVVGGLYDSLRKSLLPKLEKQKATLEAAGFQVEVETPLGIPFFEVNRLGQQRSSSLVVVGSLGESLVGEVLLGSTAYSILQNALLPVLLIRVEITNGPDQGERCRAICGDLFRHILFLTDFSDTAERALLYLEHVVREAKSQVTLLHVQDQAKIDKHVEHRLKEFNEIDAERLKCMKLRLLQSGASGVGTEVPYGSPTSIILERARSGVFSAILMGSQGRGFIQEVLMGSVAHNVARLAPLPVMFIPASR
jgi:nucleotide-binding universal stress UspA family protein